MDEAPTRRQAAAVGPLVAGEGDAQGVEALLEAAGSIEKLLPLAAVEDEILGSGGDRHVLDEEEEVAAGVLEGADEGGVGDRGEIFPGHGQGDAAEYPGGSEPGDDLPGPPVNAPSPPRVGGGLVALHAHHGDHVGLAPEPGDYPVVYQKAVGEDGEECAAAFLHQVQDAGAQKRLTPCQKDHRSAEVLGLGQNFGQARQGQLPVRRAPVRPGVAPPAGEVAAGGDADDEVGRDVDAPFFPEGPAAGGPLLGRERPQGEVETARGIERHPEPRAEKAREVRVHGDDVIRVHRCFRSRVASL